MSVVAPVRRMDGAPAHGEMGQPGPGQRGGLTPLIGDGEEGLKLGSFGLFVDD